MTARTPWLAALLLTAACGSPTCDEVPGTVVFDGAFSLGLECWVAEGGGISATEEEAGDRAPWIDVAAPAEGSAQESVALSSNRFAVVDRQPMTVTFRARGESQRTLWIDIRGEESELQAYWNRVTLESSWETYTLEFESNATADDAVLAFWFGEQAVGASIDDITLDRQ